MGIDADGLLTEGVAQDNVSGFSPDAGEAQEIFEPVGHLAAEALDDFSAALLDGAGFDAVEVDLADLFLELLQRYSRKVSRRFIFFKQLDGDLVYEIVPRLGRQDQSDEKFERIAEVEIEFGVGMDLFEPANDLFDELCFARGFCDRFSWGGHFGFHRKYATQKRSCQREEL